MEHTSGFRPPGRDVTHAQEAKRTKHDHAARRYQRHIDERFKVREIERARTDAVQVPPQEGVDGEATEEQSQANSTSR